MIPRLFTPDPARDLIHVNSDNLDVFGQVIQTNGLGILSRCTSAVVTSSLEDGMSIEMTVLDDDPLAPSINVGSIVSAKANKNGRRQAFVIEEVKRNLDGTIDIYGVSYAQHMMRLNVAFVQSRSWTTKAQVADMLASRTNPGRLIFVPVGADPAKTALSFPGFPMSVAEMFNGDFEEDGKKKNFLEWFGGELEFDNETVYWHDHMGQTSNLKVVPGRNMTEFAKSDEYDLETSSTSCLGYYYDADTGTVVNADYAYSPYDPVGGTEKYLAPVPYQSFVAVDFTDEFEETPTAAQVKTLAQNWIADKGVNKSTIEVSFDALQNDAFGLGDLVRVVNEQYSVDVQKRIVGYKYDSLAEQYVSVEIGDPRTTINEAIGSVKSTTVKASGSGTSVNTWQQLGNAGSGGNTFTLANTYTHLLVTGHNSTTANNTLWIIRPGNNRAFQIGGTTGNITLSVSGTSVTVTTSGGTVNCFAIQIGTSV